MRPYNASIQKNDFSKATDHPHSAAVEYEAADETRSNPWLAQFSRTCVGSTRGRNNLAA